MLVGTYNGWYDLEDIRFVNNVGNVLPGNQEVTVTIGGVPTTRSLTPGAYDGFDLASQLGSLFDGVITACSYNWLNHTMLIANDVAFTVACQGVLAEVLPWGTAPALIHISDVMDLSPYDDATLNVGNAKLPISTTSIYGEKVRIPDIRAYLVGTNLPVTINARGVDILTVGFRCRVAYNP